MSKSFLSFFLFFCFATGSFAQVPPSLSTGEMKPKKNNYLFFSSSVPEISQELTELTPAAYQSHPEFGINPYNTQCEDCIELIHKRTDSSRYFIGKGTKGRTFYVQHCSGTLHYLVDGQWVTIDPRLKPHPQLTGVYHAPSQPIPVKVDANTGVTTLQFQGFDLDLNSGLRAIHVTSSGDIPVFGNISLQNSTVGDEGMYTYNAWAGIDREVAVDRASIKTNFIFHSLPALQSPGGWLAFEEDIVLPQGFVLVRDYNGLFTPENYWMGALVIKDLATNSEVARWEQAAIWDNSGTRPSVSDVAYEIIPDGNGYKLRTLVNVAWLSDPSRVFPVTVDPLVSGTATYSAGLIGFTNYAPGNGFCGSSSAWCQASLNVNFPGQATFTNVVWGLTYNATNGAWMSDGGFRIAGPCGEDPSNPNNWWSCGPPAGNFPGNCNGAGINSPALITCVPPQCPPSVQTFRLKNIDCNFGGSGNCGTAFLRTTNNTWTMTVQGQTVAQPNPPTSSMGTTICAGTVTIITATGQWGVPGYTYLWAPGGQTTQSITVAPAVNTTYTCTITDACGLTASNTVAITVVTNNLTPAPVVNYTMNPVSGNPCPVTITFCTDLGNNYGGGNENYQWGFPGGTVLSGGGLSGSTTGPTYGGAGASANCAGGPYYSVQYTVPGSYWASVSITKSGSCTSVNVPIVICGAVPIELVTFEARYMNGQVQLHWITESESDNDFFTVERSVDGINFEKVAEVDGAGNSSTRLEYYAYDESPPSGVVYYRLSQTDNDGDITYSSLAAVEVSFVLISDLGLAPNPSSGITRLYFEMKGAASAIKQLSVFDQSGKEIHTRTVSCKEGYNEVFLDLKSSPPGAYLISISSETGDQPGNRIVLIRE